MSEGDRRATRPAERQASEVVARNRIEDGLDRWDDGQVVELVSNAYRKLFERFISLDRQRTSIRSIASAN
jgi:hypothetical protein